MAKFEFLSAKVEAEIIILEKIKECIIEVLDYEDQESNLNQLLTQGFTITDHERVTDAIELNKLISTGNIHGAVEFFNNSSLSI